MPEYISTVAFYAHTHAGNPTIPLHNGQKITFDVEVLDYGSGYDPSIGRYTAPVSGLYVVTWTMVVADHSFARVFVMLNGAKVAGGESDSENGLEVHPATQLILQNLRVGDQLEFIVDGGKGYIDTYEHHPRSTFTGWLLQEVDH